MTGVVLSFALLLLCDGTVHIFIHIVVLVVQNRGQAELGGWW